MSRKAKFEYDIRVRAPKGERWRTETRVCAWEGCARPAEHRAPVSRDRLNEYQWFCMEHAREWNQSWDYFRGMSDDEVAHFQRNATTWHRPTWRLGANGSAPRDPAAAQARRAETEAAAAAATGRGASWTAAGAWRLGVDAAFAFLDDGPASLRAEIRSTGRKLSPLDRKALHALSLEEDATLGDARRRYKELVKRYHPDVNGGDRTAEQRLSEVIGAWRQIKASPAFRKDAPRGDPQ